MHAGPEWEGPPVDGQAEAEICVSSARAPVTEKAARVPRSHQGAAIAVQRGVAGEHLDTDRPRVVDDHREVFA